jgi:LemA protein
MSLIWLAPLLLAVLGLAAAVVLFNGLIRLKNDMDRAWHNVDVLLKQRYDEIPSLVRICKAYMDHERETLSRVAAARRAGLEASGPAESCRADGEARQALADLFALAESYPDLKASQQFLALQKRITGLESEIADRREYFNDCVNNYNVRIAQVPDVFLARLLRMRPRSYMRFPAFRSAPDTKWT